MALLNARCFKSYISPSSFESHPRPMTHATPYSGTMGPNLALFLLSSDPVASTDVHRLWIPPPTWNRQGAYFHRIEDLLCPRYAPLGLTCDCWPPGNGHEKPLKVSQLCGCTISLRATTGDKVLEGLSGMYTEKICITFQQQCERRRYACMPGLEIILKPQISAHVYTPCHVHPSICSVFDMLVSHEI
jgi:hypothetical protein